MEVMASSTAFHRSVTTHHAPGKPERHSVLVFSSTILSRKPAASCGVAARTLRYHDGLRKTSVADAFRSVSMSEGFEATVSSSLRARDGKKADRSREGAGLTSDDLYLRGQTRGVVSAVFERFTERAIKSVMLAQREAKALGKVEVGTEQLLLGLIAEDRSGEGFLGSGVTIDRAREAVRGLADERAGSSINADKPATEVPFSRGSKRVFEAALEHSRRMGHNYIAPEHIAIALLAVDDGGAGLVIDRLGLSKDKLNSEAANKLQGELAKEGRAASSSVALPAKAAAGATTSGRRLSRREKGALNDFCVDLTARATEGKIDPVIGRESEVQRVIQILARRTKNNPILLGEPGVGKTAIAEGLALRIANATIPEYLTGRRVMSLDIGLLLAGAKERGELESRVTTLIEEIRTAGNIILLIDEVHTLVGSGSVGRGGSSGAGLDMANLLKPALARGQLQCIGATTLNEHRKHIEKDKALARRFQPVMVHEPSQEDTVKILLGLRSMYEKHHKCRITEEAVEAAVHLSARYIADRFLPDKAIDLLDEAGSRARINEYVKRRQRQVAILSESPSSYWQELRNVQAAQESGSISQSSLRNADFLSQSGCGSAASVSIVISESDVADSNIHSKDELADSAVVVGPAEIASVASMWSGIPVDQLTADEELKLMRLEDILRTHVVGQDDAVSAISRAVRRARVGLKDPDRPIAAMLFCGPTGVGKTELTKALAQHYFGSEDSMIRLDMSEYMERHSVSKLIGSPPGYVGYGDGGTLTESVRRKPFTVILMDEIEKAHPDVFNILLQMFEDGHLTDSQRRKVSFKNTLIVMTSNVGSSAIARGGSNQIGFTLSADPDGGHYASLKSLVLDELKGYFRPELLNRMDEVVVFRSLEISQVREIVEMMMKETKARLQTRRIGLEISESMFQLICNEGYDRSYGARPLRRALIRLVEDNLSEALLSGEYQEGDTALVDIDESGNPVVIHHMKPDRCESELCLPIVKPVLLAE